MYFTSFWLMYKFIVTEIFHLVFSHRNQFFAKLRRQVIFRNMSLILWQNCLTLVRQFGLCIIHQFVIFLNKTLGVFIQDTEIFQKPSNQPYKTFHGSSTLIKILSKTCWMEMVYISKWLGTLMRSDRFILSLLPVASDEKNVMIECDVLNYCCY